jgi:predicted amidohydrolase YtcJ
MRRRLVTVLVMAVTAAACGGGSVASTTTADVVATTATAATSSTTSAATDTTTGAGSTTTRATTPPADLAFINGNVLTFNPTLREVTALAVRDDRIVGVGPGAVFNLIGPETTVVDLGGRTMIPGFVDAHDHIMNQGDYGATLEERQQAALANGITTLGNMYTDEGLVSAMENLDASGGLQVRVSLYLVYNTACGDPIGEWYLDREPTRVPGEMLRIGGVKVFADGGTCTSPSFSAKIADDVQLVDPYVSVEELTGVVERAQARGFQVAIHAIGDRAVGVALDGIEAALHGGPNTYRHRIEHSSVVRPDQLNRYGQIGVVATIFATYPSCTPFGAPLLPAYQAWEWPYADLIAANPGLHVAWHGDAPYFSINPLVQLFGLVTRMDVNGNQVCSPPAWLAEDTFDVAEALRMMTYESAYALFREDEVGTLAPGYLADLVILSEDPLTVDPLEIKDIRVLMTMVGGHTAYCADPAGSLCP